MLWTTSMILVKHYNLICARVCAKLVENRDTCEELSFPSEGRELSFWEITGQQRWNWKDKICGGPNPGTNW